MMLLMKSSVELPRAGTRSESADAGERVTNPPGGTGVTAPAVLTESDTGTSACGSAEQESILPHLIEFELRRSGYPLDRVHCEIGDSTLVLNGEVGRYYYIQITLKIVQKWSGGRKIVSELRVRPGE